MSGVCSGWRKHPKAVAVEDRESKSPSHSVAAAAATVAKGLEQEYSLLGCEPFGAPDKASEEGVDVEAGQKPDGRSWTQRHLGVSAGAAACASAMLVLLAGLALVCASAVPSSPVRPDARESWEKEAANQLKAQSHSASGWYPATDPKSGETYYYNPVLKKTSWTKPADLGRAPTHTSPAPAPERTPAEAKPDAKPKPKHHRHPQEPAEAPHASSAPGACPGSVMMDGVGRVALANAKWNLPGDPGGHVEVHNGVVRPHMKGRSYFSHSCTPGVFAQSQYVNLKLLGKTMRYTTDLSGAKCGCNAALYLTNMRQHSDPSACQDHYCDASSVCSGSCAEVDLQEANMHAWFSTVHMSRDSQGWGGGYGFLRDDWNASTYGPGAACIDTTKAFQVAISFIEGPPGRLAEMRIRLSQRGRPCPGVSAKVHPSKYSFKGRQGLPEVSDAMAQGMTPIISYWSQPGPEGMGWMDGLGPDGKGPCHAGHAEQCAATVAFSDFSVEDDAGQSQAHVG